ncbi:type II toxin-antitoxin system HicA family toxin [bacterium]|nr:type II toxin-antitoxin system HicA family toxin [bacterium]
MGKLEKLYEKIVHGLSDSNIRFTELCSLLLSFGFTERIKGDHHIFTMNGINEILNIQPKGSKAKAYQIRQVRNIIIRYHLHLEEK